jgi:hypothetical protein
MAQWTKVLLFVFAFPCVNSSRIYQNHESKSKSEFEGGATAPGISAEMEEALNTWYSDKKKPYRFVVLNVPEDESADMTGYTAPADKNYADFIQAMKNCPGPCIGAYEFSWEVPRGGGFVPNSEAAMFTWAPDDPPEKYAGMRNRRKYMSMKMDLTNFRVSAIKKVISRWNPKIMQAGDADDLKPEWVVPQLRGGRFGNRADNLNSDGTALLEQLQKEVNGGASDPIVVDEEPDTGVGETSTQPPITPDTPKPKPKPNVGPVQPMTSQDKAEMLEIMKHMVDQAIEDKMTVIMKKAETAAQNAVGDVAKKAAKEAVVEVFKDMVKKI